MGNYEIKHILLIASLIMCIGRHCSAQQSTTQELFKLRNTALLDTLSTLLPYVQKNEVMQVVIEQQDSVYMVYATTTLSQSEVVFNPPTFDTELRGVPVLVYLGNELFSRSDPNYGRRLAAKYGKRLENDLSKDGSSVRTDKMPTVHDPFIVLIQYSKGRVLSARARGHGITRVPHLISVWDLFTEAEERQRQPKK